MGCTSRVILLFGLQIASTSFGLPHQFPPVIDDASLISNDFFETADVDKHISDLGANMNNIEEDNLLEMGNFLAELLMMPWNNKGLPLLYIENLETLDPDVNDNALTPDDDYSAQQLSPKKRSRYYHKYPWKRQNARQTYDADNRYLCQPSKDDVYRLLVALHETRQGNRGHTINFCNRKRPATAIFTNIRFLG